MNKAVCHLSFSFFNSVVHVGSKALYPSHSHSGWKSITQGQVRSGQYKGIYHFAHVPNATCSKLKRFLSQILWFKVSTPSNPWGGISAIK